MRKFATPLYIQENPDSPVAKHWQECVQEANDALDQLYMTAGRNCPDKYITTAEIAQRTGMKKNAAEQNIGRRTRWFPFDPVFVAGHPCRVRYFHRQPVEGWIHQYNARNKWRRGERGEAVYGE